MSKLQSVAFLIDKGWTQTRAEKWLTKRKLKTSYYGKGVDKKFKNQLRYRQAKPNFEKYTTKKYKNGINLIIGFEPS